MIKILQLIIALVITAALLFALPYNGNIHWQSHNEKSISIKSTNFSRRVNYCTLSPFSLSTEHQSIFVQSSPKPLLIIFITALITRFIAVFTPYVHAFIPMVLSTLTFQGKPRKTRHRNTLYFSIFILLIFIFFGALISIIISTTGLNKLGSKWYINLLFFRLYAGLGLSFLGAFELSLPRSWRTAATTKAEQSNIGGIFYKALTLPLSTFSSTFPLIILVLFIASKSGVSGAISGMAGFSAGLTLPFLYPRIINLMPPTVLNQIKVLLGFLALFLSLKFLSNACIDMGWHFMDREVFIGVCIVLAFLLGMYMLGVFRLTNDYLHTINIYGQEYVSLTRLFIAVTAFTFIIYVLPGFWGAPLNGLNSYLPPQATLDRF